MEMMVMEVEGVVMVLVLVVMLKVVEMVVFC